MNITPVVPEIREGHISIKAKPDFGEGRWGKGVMPSASERPTADVIILPRVSELERDGVRMGMIAALQAVAPADAIAAAVSYLLSSRETHPDLLGKVLSVEVTRGTRRARIIDVLTGKV